MQWLVKYIITAILDYVMGLVGKSITSQKKEADQIKKDQENAAALEEAIKTDDRAAKARAAEKLFNGD